MPKVFKIIVRLNDEYNEYLNELEYCNINQSVTYKKILLTLGFEEIVHLVMTAILYCPANIDNCFDYLLDYANEVINDLDVDTKTISIHEINRLTKLIESIGYQTSKLFSNFNFYNENMDPNVYALVNTHKLSNKTFLVDIVEYDH